MEHGAWSMGHGAWGMEHGAWGMEHGAWSMEPRRKAKVKYKGRKAKSQWLIANSNYSCTFAQN